METRTDILIAGGGLGGCAAALAASSHGLRVTMLEENTWIGGQLTAQGVPPDEHGWIEELGCTASYRRLRNAIRDYYRAHYPLTAQARAARHLNPGSGWVSPLCHEPKVSHAVLQQMLAGVEILRPARVISVSARGDHIDAVTVVHEGRERVIRASYYLDATELGDLLPLAGVELVTGAESRGETGEPSAPLEAHPDNVQAFSWCFAMTHHPGEDHRIGKPERYGFWADYIPRLTPPWPGKLLSLTTPHPRTMETLHYRFDPVAEDGKAFSGLWTYRRLIDRTNFTPGHFTSDICLVNWPMIDYLEGELCSATPQDAGRCLSEAKQLSLCMFYWLQQNGWPGLRLSGDALGTTDGFAQAPYIRESRRIRAQRTIREQDVLGKTDFADSVGIGSYRIDLHPSTGGDNYIDVPSQPFQIPLGALLPLRVRNLLPACKNIGTTHITNGCYRLHPVEWNIGEAAGLLAAYCLQRGTEPFAVPAQVEDFQRLLRNEGVELSWPTDLDPNEGDAHKHAR
ncbi:MAG: FAD-dependent oxidoreductase [Bryobacterales bacterium]|nr:FAD-dependent oxidoreductase [Bryobacterales bacterium]